MKVSNEKNVRGVGHPIGYQVTSCSLKGNSHDRQLLQLARICFNKRRTMKKSEPAKVIYASSPKEHTCL